jgi:hypothetical protein
MHHSDCGCWTARGRAAQDAAGRASARRDDRVVPAPSNRGMGAVLAAWAVVVLDAAVPRYACCDWGGPSSDGRGGKEGREQPRADLMLEVPRRGPLVRRPRNVRAAYGAVVWERAENG